MSDEDPAGGLRIGGWLPSYEDDVADPRRTQTPDGDRPAVTVRRAGAPAVRRHGKGRLAPAGTVLASTTVLVVIALFTVTLLGGGAQPAEVDRGPAAAPPLVWPPDETPSTGVPGSPATPSATPANPSVSPSPGAVEGRVPAPTTKAPMPVPPSATTRTPPAPALREGARIGLEPVTRPGYRVRHAQFVGRVDPIGSGSSALEKADSTFVVRAGLASRRCVSLESVNYPGYFLRHQDFAIHLHRRDGSALYAADTTFCPVSGLAGQGVSLRSHNYPDRYLSHSGSRLYITAPGGGTSRGAMTFAVRAAL